MKNTDRFCKRLESSDHKRFESILDSKTIDRFYKRLDNDQRELYEALTDDDTIIVCSNSMAGTGKSTVAVMAALELRNEGRINHIYYVRFADDRALKLGFLPGDEDEKQAIFMNPFFSACEEFGIPDYEVERMVDAKDVILCTDIGLRGCNIENSMVIIDEAQNAHFEDLKLVLTRIHDNCKCALIGHSGQNDNFKMKEKDHTFEKYIEHLCQKPWAKEINLKRNYRGKLSNWADMLEP